MWKIPAVLILLYGACHYVGNNLDFDKALKLAETHKSASWAPRYSYALGSFYYMKSDYPKALAAYDRLLTDHPTCQYAAKALFRGGDSAENVRDWERAKSFYRIYLVEFPAGKDAEIIQKRLEYLNYKH